MPIYIIQVTVAVCVFAFDLLYLDGTALVHLPLRERRRQLDLALPQVSPGLVQIAQAVELCTGSCSGLPESSGEATLTMQVHNAVATFEANDD